MNTSSTNPEFGPLPGQDRNADLQTLSFRVFEGALPVERFNFRDERQNDRGVDASIELRWNSSPTNLRAQVQLKGTDSANTNQDGSISHSASVSNLNYLLNGQSPLYILYVAPRNELRYLWAHDERKRIEETNPVWQNQNDVTLRFVNVLTDVALDEIYQRILREARFQRSIHETLSRSLPTDQVVIGITAETLQHTDPNQLKDLLEAGGFAVVASGYANEIIGSLDLINPSVGNQPYFQLLRPMCQNRVRQNPVRKIV